MTAITDSVGTSSEAVEVKDQSVIAEAADAGFRLAHYETESGQQVWEWRRGTEPRPQFIARRVALHWMSEFLDQERRVAFVSPEGPSHAVTPR